MAAASSAQHAVQALSPESGETVWRYPLNGFGFISGGLDTIVAATHDQIVSLDATSGALRWTQRHITPNANTAPVIDSSLVYFLAFHSSAYSTLEVLSPLDGSRLSRALIHADVSLGVGLAMTDNAIMVPDGCRLVAADKGPLVATRWVRNGECREYIGGATPAFLFGRLVVRDYRLGVEPVTAIVDPASPTGEAFAIGGLPSLPVTGRGGVLFLADDGRSDGRTVRAVNSMNGALIWSRQFDEAMVAAIVINEFLLVVGRNGLVTALSSGNGRTLWMERLEGVTPSHFHGGAVGVSAGLGRIYIPTSDNRLVALGL